MPEIGQKRDAAEAGLNRLDSVEDACKFVTDVLGEEAAAPVVERIKEQEVDGSVLFSMTETDLKEELGLTKFGLRRKISLRLSYLRSLPQGASAADEAAPKAPETLPAAARGTSGAVGAQPPAAAAAPVAPRDAQTPQPAPEQQLQQQVQPAPLVSAAAAEGAGGSSSPAAAAEPPAGSNRGQSPSGMHPEPLAHAPAVSASPEAAETREQQGEEQKEGEEEEEEVEVVEAAGLSAGELASAEMAEQAVIDAQLDAEALCVTTCRWVLQQMRSKLTCRERRNWGPAPVVRSRLEELATLEAKGGPPGMLAVVVGNTGAMLKMLKSTMLNSLLGERSVPPTNGMRACTAALVELSFLASSEQHGDEPYAGEVEFISEEEWEKELDHLFADLVQQDGRAVLHVPEDRPHYGSWCKVVAVYGEAYTKSTIREGDGHYRPPTVLQLRRKLRAERAITRMLGKSHRVTAPDAASFKKRLERFVDSSNEVDGKSFWPIVRMVRMKSSKWDVLKTGARLVDAPGVRDDNTARDGVVQRFFKEADSIWIVSHIGRAINDKTAKDMLGESFRRQILMDGQYGNMIFVATQSDNLLRTEIAENLGLEGDASIEECATKRNEYTKARIQEDFIDGLEEMQRMSGSEVSRAELQRKFSLPVFTVSGMDYQKLSGIREGDGDPKVWQQSEGTEVPALTRFVHNAALQQRRVRMRRYAESVVHFCDALHVVMSDDGTSDVASQLKAKEAFQKAVGSRLPPEAKKVANEFGSAIAGFFSSTLGDQLSAGAVNASGEVMSTVQSWGAKPRDGGMYWGTYKAHCRREGVFRQNMNEQMAEPIYRAVSTYWDQTFTTSMQAAFDAVKVKGKALVEEAQGSFKKELEEAGLKDTSARLAALGRNVETKCVAAVVNAVDQAKDTGRNMQREVNRAITPAIQEQLKPAYLEANNESGSGSHARRKIILESRVESQRQAMFKVAIEPVMSGLANLRVALTTTIMAGLAGIHKEMEIGYSGFWTSANAATLEARRGLAPDVHMLTMEATTALRKLLASQGEEFEEPDVDDDEIQVVKDGDAAAGASKAAVEVIDMMDDDSSDEGPAPPPLRVKTEK